MNSKEKLRDIVKANNAIEDSPSLSKKLIQNAVNNWTIDSNSDEELNKILTIIASCQISTILIIK